MADSHKRITRYTAEFVVIFLGVSLSFFAEDLREYRRERADEARSIQRLLVDLEQTRWNAVYGWAADGAVAISRITEASQGVPPPADSLSAWLTTAARCGRPVLNKAEYESLRSSGTINVIRDEGFRARLVEHYERYDPIDGIVAAACDYSFMEPIAGEVETELQGFWPAWRVVGSADVILSNREFLTGLAHHYVAKRFAAVRLELLEEGRVALIAEAQEFLGEGGGEP